MKVFRKDQKCLNCGATLREDHNYCPECGQKNSHNNVLLGTLLRDYFGEAFSLDSRFFKSIFPFFFKPGYLTSQFNAGRRVSFINPVRLYLAMSLFYFFILSLSLTKSLNWQDVIKENQNNKDQIPAAAQQKLDSLGIIIKDQMLLDSLTSDLNIKIDTSTEVSSINDYIDFLKDPEVTDLQVLDSLGMESTNTNRKLATQVRKIARKDLDVFVPFLLQNVPIMMLLLLPIFALILKLLYIRRKVLYIRHLVHGLYLHSFAYLIYGLILLLNTYMGFGENVKEWFSISAFVLVSVYTYISFLKVYQQGWFKTLAKFWIVGYLYAFFLLLFSVGEFLLSFFLF